MDLTRRDFIKKGGLAFLVLGIAGPLGAWNWQEVIGSEGDPGGQILVVVQLSGGNDGLNTVIPYGEGVYYDNRPTLGIRQKDVLPLNGQLGLHPSLTGLKSLFDKGKLAIINGVGYPNPNRSHFRSMDIWQTAAPDKNVPTGWLGRYLDLTQDRNANPLKALSVGSSSKIFLAQKSDAPAIANAASFTMMIEGAQAERERRMNAIQQMYKQAEGPFQLAGVRGITALDAADKIHKIVQDQQKLAEQGYPKNSRFAEQLQLIGKLIGAGTGTKAYFTQLGGFDDHAREQEQHARLLKEMDGSLSAFFADLDKRGLANRTAVLIYSEFGRRLKENASGGTDHGTAAPVFVLGGSVKGGLYGQLPSLTTLDNGDLKYAVDFRSVYATMLDRCLQVPSKEILGGTFENMNFI